MNYSFNTVCKCDFVCEPECIMAMMSCWHTASSHNLYYVGHHCEELEHQHAQYCSITYTDTHTHTHNIGLWMQSKTMTLVTFQHNPL